MLHSASAPIALRKRVRDRRFKRGSSGASCGEAVGAQQPLGRCGAGDLGNEAVPPAHPPVARDQPLPNGERLAAILIDDCDLPQPAQQLARARVA